EGDGSGEVSDPSTKRPGRDSSKYGPGPAGHREVAQRHGWRTGDSDRRPGAIPVQNGGPIALQGEVLVDGEVAGAVTGHVEGVTRRCGGDGRLQVRSEERRVGEEWR